MPGRAAECQLELPSVTGDVAFVLWLLIRGAKVDPLLAPAS